MFVFTAFLFAILSTVTGVVAVGNGQHWNFSFKDILRGQQNALLYVWVTFSTMFSLAHVAAILGWVITKGFANHGEMVVFIAHTLIGALLVIAHLYIKYALAKTDRDLSARTLWEI